jgi:hypothetical protein
MKYNCWQGQGKPWPSIALECPKKHHLRPQNGFESSRPKKNVDKKVVKMENHVELVEEVGGHQCPPRSILYLSNGI